MDSSSKKKNDKTYYIYILLCENDIYYTGIATDYKRRLEEHKNTNNSHKGAKFTKSHKPIKIVALWKCDTRSLASKLEIRIKKLSKDEKTMLVSNNRYFKKFFNDELSCSQYKKVSI